MRFRRARTPYRAGDTRSLRARRALHKREAARLRCKVVLPPASSCPHSVRWVARVARLRATVRPHSGEEAQRVRFRRARARRAALAALGLCAMKGRCTSEKPPSFGARLCSTCQTLSSLGEVGCACRALALHCARSLLGRGPAPALPTRARRAALATRARCEREGRCTSEKPPAFGARSCSHLPALALTW